MSLHTLDLIRWNRVSIALGGIAWAVLALARLLGWMMLDDLALMLLLALCVIAPLAIPLVSFPNAHRLLYWLPSLVLFLQPFASLLGGTSFFFSTGPLAATLAIVWFLFTGLLALIGLTQLFQAHHRSLSTVCLSVALLYLPIGGIWMVLARLGLQPLGFGVHTDLLTAVHFHFIPLAALLMVGLTGSVMQTTQRGVWWKIYRILALCMLVNPLLVATGITVTQLTDVHYPESIAAILLALCLLLIALFNLRFIVPATTSPLSRWLLIFSSASVVFTMLFACAYALGTATRIWTITISQMILVHGWVNALVFALCGLLGWRLRRTQGKE